MPQSQSDHGVTGQPHWLLDEELARHGNARAARALPALLRHEAVAQPARPSNPPTDAQRSGNGVLFVLGLLAALAVYAVLRATDLGGALQDFLSHWGADDAQAMTAVFRAPDLGAGEAPELAALRALLAERSAAASDEPTKPKQNSKRNSTDGKAPAAGGGGGGGTDDGDDLDDVLDPVTEPLAPLVDTVSGTTEGTVDALSSELEEAAGLEAGTLDLN